MGAGHISLLQGSADEFVAGLVPTPNGKRQRTVVSKFKSSLSEVRDRSHGQPTVLMGCLKARVRANVNTGSIRIEGERQRCELGSDRERYVLGVRSASVTHIAVHERGGPPPFP